MRLDRRRRARYKGGMSTDASPAAASIEERLAALEVENARLRRTPPPGGKWRPFVSALCIVLASVLVPVSIVGGWARGQLVDEQTFVATFSPLARDPQVQTAVIDAVTSTIEDKVDLASVTDQVFDGIVSLGLPPRAAAALNLLRKPAVQALQGLVQNTVTRVVQSDAFTTTWDTALRASHRALVATASGSSANGAVTISDNGTIGIQLGPIIDSVKQRLVARGVPLASAIPSIDKTIVVAQSDALVTVRVVYGVSAVLGWWLPFVALALFVLGLLVARRRSAALVGAGVGIAVGAGALAASIDIGGSLIALGVIKAPIDTSALGVIYGQVVAAMTRTAVVVMLIGIVLAVLAWTSGRSRGARALRSGVGAVNENLRAAMLARGADTGRFGHWMYAQRRLVRVLLALLLVLWLWLLRPFGTGEVLLVLVVGLLVWWVCELVQRRPDAAADALEAAAGTPAADEGAPGSADAPAGG